MASVSAYFTHGEKVSSPVVLENATGDVELDVTMAREIISSDRFTKEVREEERWRILCVQSVPTLIVNGRHVVQGGQSPAACAEILQRIAIKAWPANKPASSTDKKSGAFPADIDAPRAIDQTPALRAISNKDLMTDHQAVFDLVDKYLRCIYEGNTEGLRGVFHPDARIEDVVTGTYRSRSADEYIRAVGSRQSPSAGGEAFTMVPISIQVQGDMAAITADLRFLGNHFINVLSALRCDGRWLITHKLFGTPGM